MLLIEKEKPTDQAIQVLKSLAATNYAAVQHVIGSLLASSINIVKLESAAAQAFPPAWIALRILLVEKEVAI